MAGLGSVTGSGAWLGGCLGSVAARPAVPARRLPCRPVVLWNGCALLPCRRSRVDGAAFAPAVFPCGVRHRLGSARCVAVGRWLWVRWLLGKWLPSPFSRFFPSSFLLPPLTPIILLSLYFLTPPSSIYILYIIIYKNNIIIFNSRF